MAVPWVEKLEFPQQPVQPFNGDGYWVPAGFPLHCERCGFSFNVKVEYIETESRWFLYGDEAGRYIHRKSSGHGVDLHFFCITLVALHQSRRPRVERQIRRLKAAIAPDVDPGCWRHHFTEIWSSSPHSGRFRLGNKDAKIEYGKQWAKIVRNARPELVSFNISGCIKVPKNRRDRSTQIQQQKEDVFSQSILTTLMQMRKYRKAPVWVFDNVKDASDGDRTEGWAEECFLGLQYTRLFTYLAAGSAILRPKFVQPGSHYLLEIADFMSYCIAREFEKTVQGVKTELPSALLGKSFYQGTLGDGSVNYRWSVGLPLKEYYGV